jgi:hypothetical protein
MTPPIYTTDTSPEAYEIQLDAMRRMSPRERIGKMLRLSARVKQMSMDAIRRRHPDFDERRVGLKFIELTYGADLAAKVRNAMEDRGIG